MTWWQSECKYGDMIRISFGSFYHYGIFVSDEEVIQFGLAPVEGLMNRKFDEISVCVTDIDGFAMGRIVEVASLERGDKQKRLSPKKTVLRARERIGERGYDILHNNCEHFARYCYFGEKRCEVTEQVVDFWRNKSKCDVYLSQRPNEIPENEHETVQGDGDARSEYIKRMLEYALMRSFGYKPDELVFSKGKNGKWLCDKCFFNISRSGDYVAVAVSNREVGINIGQIKPFEVACADDVLFSKMKRRILKKGEPQPSASVDLLKMLSQKESIFNRSPKGRFKPSRIKITDDTASLKLDLGRAELLCSISGSDVKKSFLYIYSGGEASRIKDVIWI